MFKNNFIKFGMAETADVKLYTMMRSSSRNYHDQLQYIPHHNKIQKESHLNQLIILIY